MRFVEIIGLTTALACGAAGSQAAVTPLRLCADPANLPFSSNASESAQEPAAGLYVEIGQAIAQALGRPMDTVWSLSYFGKRNLRATLLADKCDLAVGLPAVQDFMGPRLIFTRPILNLGYGLVVPRDRTARGLDDLKGQRVAVQFGSPPQSMLAERGDIVLVTTMDPEEAMRRLSSGEADAAFIWGANASYVNHVLLRDRFKVIPVDAPQMQFPAAIGLSSKRPVLRDEIDALLDGLAPRIQEISAKYLLAMGTPIDLTDAAPIPMAAAEPIVVPVQADARKEDATNGKELFNGTCSHCHGPDAVVEDRKINLRRLQVKYGEQMEETYAATVTNGRPSKGMPAWKEVLKPQDFVDILSYLHTVQEK